MTQIHGTWYEYSIGTPTHLQIKKIQKFHPFLGGAGYMNSQKLKNNQNSKETIKLSQIHSTWYAYSIGTPTPLQIKKIQKSHPFLGRRNISSQTTFRAWERLARRPYYYYFLSLLLATTTTIFTWSQYLVVSVHKMGTSRRPFSCTECGLSTNAQTSRCPK